MKKCMEHYWQVRLENCRKALENNNFAVFVAEDIAQARQIVLEEIFPKTGATSASWGDSLTLHATGILDVLRGYHGLHIVKAFEMIEKQEILTAVLIP